MGRPRGVKETKPRNTAARKMAAQAAAEGITPLEVMMRSMRADWAAAESLEHTTRKDDVEAQAKIAALRAQAVSTADRCAPYLHPRLASTDTTIKSDNVHRVVADKPMTEDDWVSRYVTPANDAVVAGDDAEEDRATG